MRNVTTVEPSLYTVAPLQVTCSVTFLGLQSNNSKINIKINMDFTTTINLSNYQINHHKHYNVKYKEQFRRYYFYNVYNKTAII